MKKSALSVFLTIAMLASLAGCGGGDGNNSGSSPSSNASSSVSSSESAAESEAESSAESSAEEKSSQSAETDTDASVVEVWTADRHDVEYINSMIDAFNQDNDAGTEIQQTVIADDYISMLTMAYSSGTAPDVAGIGASSFASIAAEMNMYVESGLFTPLDSYIEASGEAFEAATEYSKNLYPGMNTINGQIYWVPTAVRSGVRVIYNKDLAEAVGTTEMPTKLADLVQLSKDMTAQGAGDSYGYAATSSSPFVRLLQGVAELSGQNAYGYDYQKGVYDFSGFKPILEVFGEMLKEDSLFPGSATQGVDAMRAQFADGKVGIWANASQEVGVFTEQFPVNGFEWGVAMPPTLEGEIKGALTSDPQKGYVMMSSTKNPDAAWSVIEYFSSEDFLKGYMEKGYALPISSHIADIVDPNLAGRMTDFARTAYESVYPAPPAITVEGEFSNDVLWNAAMGLVEIDAAIEDLNTRYNEALERDIADGKTQRLIIADYDPMQPSAGTFEYRDN